MSRPDLNLLITLDVLLAEGSVARAARRLGLSASAMSRALARLRDTTADPLLVRAGRGLVPSPRAMELRERVRQVVHDAEAALRPAKALDVAKLARTFVLRTSDGFVENFGARLVTRIAEEAPAVRLRFLPKLDRDSTALREGTVDLETGVVGTSMGPEVIAQALFRDRFVGVVCKGHALAKGKVTAARYAAGRHVLVSRQGVGGGPLDEALAALGMRRNGIAIVSGFAAAIALARGSDLIASVPEKHTGRLRDGMVTFALPMAAQKITVSLLWHPRMEADPAHRWLRERVREACNAN
jgi:DNA-binding transcriptional LysR family regulator